MPWVTRRLRGTKVYARARADGTLLVAPGGRVDIRYRNEDGATVYRASARNLEATGEETDSRPVGAEAPVEAPPAGAVVVYTDGACRGNPGPMGVGVVVVDGDRRREIGEFLGEGTNNIAELTAVERALDALEGVDPERPILLHIDSAYAIGVLSRGWKAKANVELVARLRERLARWPRLRFVKVEGHAGVAENERCDALATAAIRSAGGTRRR